MTVPPILAFAIGAALIAYVPYSYYTGFNTFGERVAEHAGEGRVNLDAAGTSWIGYYNSGRGGFDYALFTTTAYLFSWEWVKPDELKDLTPLSRQVLRAVASTLLVAILVGLINGRAIAGWMSRRLRPHLHPSLPRHFSPSLSPIPTVGLDPRRVSASSNLTGDPNRFPIRSWFILFTWLVVPCYVLYVLSIDGASLPHEIVIRPFVRDLPHTGVNAMNSFGYDSMIRPIIENIRPSSIRWWAVGLLVSAAILWLIPFGSTFPRRVMRLAGFALAFLSLVAAMYLIAAKTTGQDQSIWMPRYLGHVWPAFAILVCMLIDRLPTLPLRCAIFTLLIGVNLLNFGARLFIGTEPPTERIAIDLAASRDMPSTRLYSYGTGSSGAPGTGRFVSTPTFYYAAIITGDTLSPDEVRGWGRRYLRTFDYRDTGRQGTRTIARDMQRSRQLTRVIFWQEVAYDNQFQSEPLADSLPDGWKLESIDQYIVRDHWTWRRLYQMRRFEWTRDDASPSSSTQPVPEA
jgi:hypothetical protein